MKVEHLTLNGSSLVRDTRDIALYTINFLKEIQVYNTSKILDIPKTNLQVKITSSPQGAIFDVMKNGNILFTNFCCFKAEYMSEIYALVIQLARMIPIYQNTIVRDPDLPQFLYTVLIAPFMASFDEIQISGEIELYIYYSLYLAQCKTK